MSDRKLYFRPASQSDEAKTKFLLVHQEHWQQRLLKMYGNTICLLDATYKTTKYALPLFMLVVKTNVDYIPIAEFVTEDEVSETILRHWKLSRIGSLTGTHLTSCLIFVKHI